MSTKGKVITAIIVAAVLVAGGAGFYFKGGDLMGLVFKKNISLNVSLAADTPVSANIPEGSINQPLAKFKLNANGGNITVDGLTINCIGNSAYSADENLALLKITSGDTSKSYICVNGKSTFNELKLTILNGSSVDLDISGNINIWPMSNPGDYFSFSIGDISAFSPSSRLAVSIRKTGAQESNKMYVVENKN